jgi:hypothetical protein
VAGESELHSRQSATIPVQAKEYRLPLTRGTMFRPSAAKQPLVLFSMLKQRYEPRFRPLNPEESCSG